MKNNAPNLSPKEWELMRDYMENSSKTPRENLITLISHVDAKLAEQGMNSGPYIMLDRLLSDEQIDFANHLELRTPTYITELAERTGKSVEEAAKLADDLCNIGVLEYKPDAQGVDRVELPIFVVGMLEQLMLAPGSFEAHPEQGVSFVFHTTGTATGNGPFLPIANHGVHRTVPVEKAIQHESRRMSWEEISTLVEESGHGSYAVCKCICRMIREEYGEAGDEPELEWCMPIGTYAEYAIRTGKARRLTKEEYLAKLKEAEDKGFVHNISNANGPSPIEYICNCDFQTCMTLRAANYTQCASLVKSNFVASVDEEKCVACGSCVEKCPMNAVKLGQKLPQKSPTPYVDKELPAKVNALSWGPERHDPDYLLHRKSIQPETGTSPCKSNCPAHIAVQGYLRLAAQGRYDEALELIKKNNPFPAVCGSICNRRCEQVCTRGDVDAPIAIDEVKKFLAYRELNQESRYIPKKEYKSGKKLAVVGGGPGGLSCAYYLAVMGHEVTVFEKQAKPGGMMQYGIPSFRLEKDVVAAEIAVLEALGVQFRCGVDVGTDVTIPELRQQGYQGFYLAIGLQGSGKLNVPGEDTGNVAPGLSLMKAVNGGKNVRLDGKVVIIGGGNIAADIARTAARCGAQSVDMYCLESLEEMPCGEEDRAECIADGITIHAGWGPKEVQSANGQCTSISFRKCLSVKNAEGRFAPTFDDGNIETAQADHIYYCIGQRTDWGSLLKGTKVELNARGLAQADPFTYQTAEPDIFVGGDAYTGQKFCIDAIAGGKQAAISLHRFAWGHNLVTGRDRNEYRPIDKENLVLEGYDTAPRQKPPVDLSKRHTFRDERGVFTEEQVKIETARCLKCGAAHVDENLCIGCGVCTTRCKMDAISLSKVHDVTPVVREDLGKAVVGELWRRRDAQYAGKPIHKYIATKVILKKVLPKKNRDKAKPRQW